MTQATPRSASTAPGVGGRSALRLPGTAGLGGATQALARRAVLAALARWRVGSLAVTLPDGSERVFGTPGAAPAAAIAIHDEDVFARILRGGEIGVGEAYMDGRWSSPDLVGLLEAAARNRQALALDAGWLRGPTRALNRVRHLRRRNTVEQAQENIAAHYDLGNDFYALWLDETLTYSGAVFTGPEQSLADAQREKYRRIATQAGVTPGSHVLEIGGGWGGFAIELAERFDCRVTTITISEAQHRLARQRVRERGLADRVDVQLRDYRDVREQYDAIVSIEMLEAVGAEYYADFFAVCDRALRPGGRLSLQSITVPDRAYEAQRRGVNWIQKHIFPGGLLPSLAAIERSLADTSLLVTEVHDVGPDYARTLAAWRARFLERADEVRALGLDDRFVRMWDYYLAICEAGFAVRATQNLQIVLEKPRTEGSAR